MHLDKSLQITKKKAAAPVAVAVESKPIKKERKKKHAKKS